MNNNHSGQLPLPFDPRRAERTLQALAQAGFPVPDAQRSLFEGLFGNSPYLARLGLREAKFLQDSLGRKPDDVLAGIRANVEAAAGAGNSADAMAILRRGKRQAALAIALADISGSWTVEQVTTALSHFADASVRAALRFLLLQAAADTDLADRSAEALEYETGLVVLAMGKYGAFELNYSSDIDLVVFYDAARFPFRKKEDARAAAVDVVKGLVKLLSEPTSDGYVFRVDLRLRPDAGATQVAISTEAAESYYEAMGQNWERAALIKARACAGDPFAAASFLAAIEPFVWRRSLDYAAIEDIHSIKRQIHAHHGHERISIAGHNIKLGRGGIREIEFFAQTQQLILGGRNPTLRAPATLAALEALRARNLVSGETAKELTQAYRFLRVLEHRLQMIEDEQTHTLPKSQEGLAHIACFMGYADTGKFAEVLRGHLETVQGHYLRLFEQAPQLTAAKGSLVFTGVEDDPDTLHTLKTLGFHDVRHIALAIRGWHHGRIRATRSPRARELLTKLAPPLLEALASTADPDGAFSQFDRFLSRLPGGVQIFSLLLANPHLLKLIADICGSAPRLSDYLARQPGVLDVLLDAGFLDRLPSRSELSSAFSAQLGTAHGMEAALDSARRFAKEQIFRIGIRIVESSVSQQETGEAFAAIAETVIAGLLPVVENEVGAGAGRVPNGALAILALGKLGGREMTATSDLDLVFVYDAPPQAEHSDGPRPLATPTYYARLAQRMIAALTVPTAAGTLYDVDMRLRPSGNKGPVAVSLESFSRYYTGEAWTWERMALNRARVVAGDSALGTRLQTAIRSALTAAPDVPKVLRDAREMRDKLAREFPAKTCWDLKFAPGGLVDIEFVAQALQLREAHQAPDVLDSSTAEALRRLHSTGGLDAAAFETLMEAMNLQQSLMQVLRIAVEGTLDGATASPGLKRLLAQRAGASDFDSLEQNLKKIQSRTRTIFENIFGM
ncbi:MAG TPA: bifunctional [glutamine synthetase] adenylyltransferase/[glutamine synthetase]-adenylyl-L-tyrosine phosphorylase [Rhizomicrobium sp.]|jgi:glutamate-ammonia-ligase adenylyltransferase